MKPNQHRFFSGASTFLALMLLLSSVAMSQSQLGIRAGHIILSDGSVQVGGWVLIAGGKITGVLPPTEKLPKGYHLVDRSNAYVSPGFVDVVSSAGAPHDLIEEEDVVDENALAVESLSPVHRDFEILPAGGVTSVVLLPAASNIVGGRGAVVHTGENADRVVAGATPMALSLTSASYASDKQAPTSFAGAHDLLRGALAAARQPKGRVASPLSMAVRGELATICRVSGDREIAAALTLAMSFGLDLTLVGCTGVLETLDALGERKIRVALPVPSLSGNRRSARLPAMLAEQGAIVALYAGSPTPSPESLRIGASLAVRGGLSRKAAMASITSLPAVIAGCKGRIGALTKGASADLALFTGHPLDLSSKHIETWVAGKRVFTRTQVVVPTAGAGENK